MQHDRHVGSQVELTAQAIIQRRTMWVTYNSQRLELCPHMLFVRREAIFLKAFNPGKRRRSDDEPALGDFRLAGLSALELTDEKFEPLPNFGGEISKDGDQLLVSVEAN